MTYCSYCRQRIKPADGCVVECGTGRKYHPECLLVIHGQLDRETKWRVYGIFCWREHLDRLLTWLLGKVRRRP